MKLLIPALLVALASTTACGPREGQASADPDQSKAHPSDTSVVTGVESATPSKPSSTRREIHPMAAAAAKAHMDGLLAKRKTLEDQLATVQSMIGRFTTRYGEQWSPDPDPKQPWRTLIGRTLAAAPINPFSPPDVATNIAVIDVPGATGDAVSPKTAGWVWNKFDHTLYAARDSAALAAAEREERRRVVRNTYGPHLASTLRSLRGQVVLYTLYETPLWSPGEVTSQQWTPLLNAGYIFETPDNPMSPREVSQRIVEIAVRGADGESVSPEIAGWVWNSTDRVLYAAGYRDGD